MSWRSKEPWHANHPPRRYGAPHSRRFRPWRPCPPCHGFQAVTGKSSYLMEKHRILCIVDKNANRHTGIPICGFRQVLTDQESSGWMHSLSHYHSPLGPGLCPRTPLHWHCGQIRLPTIGCKGIQESVGSAVVALKGVSMWRAPLNFCIEWTGIWEQ